MVVDIQSEEGQLIRQLIPLSTLPSDRFELLCKQVTVENQKPNTFLFKRNDTSNELVYLIKGSITLKSDDLKIEVIESGSDSARFALAHQIPRKIDAITNTPVRFLNINFDIIENIHIGSYQEENSDMFIDEPEDEIDEDDWMTMLLKSPIFSALPPTNLQQIIISLEEINYHKGDLIYKQDDPSDFYYIIKKGHCLLSRKPSANAKEIKLAQLRKQDTFGEDTLLSGRPRNVNITALTSTTVLRLSKHKFLTLIKDPTLKYIGHEDIQNEIDQGSMLLDVRSSDDYKKHHLPNSINAPFFTLSMQIKTFEKKKTILVISASGKTSEAAAFLLLRQGFSAFIVEGGMHKISGEINVSPTIDEDYPSIDEVTLVNEQELGISTEVNKTEVQPQITEVEKTTVPVEVQPKPKIELSLEPLESEREIIEQKADLIENTEESLTVENKQLLKTVERLNQEKQDLEKKYRVLFKQTEKLKEVLDKLQDSPANK